MARRDKALACNHEVTDSIPVWFVHLITLLVFEMRCGRCTGNSKAVVNTFGRCLTERYSFCDLREYTFFCFIQENDNRLRWQAVEVLNGDLSSSASDV